MSPDEGFRIAEERIAREAEEKTGKLDLGGLFLRRLPEQFGELTHLNSLNLSVVEEAFLRNYPMISLNQNEADWLDENSLQVLGQNSSIQKLFLVGYKSLFNLEFLSEILSLRELDLRVTGVSDLTLLLGLTSLKSLDCSAPRISTRNPCR